MPLNLNNLEDAEKFREIFVKPMVDAVKAEVQPLVLKVGDHDKRITHMENNQKKALVGYALAAFLGAVGLNAAKNWVARKFGINI